MRTQLFVGLLGAGLVAGTMSAFASEPHGGRAPPERLILGGVVDFSAFCQGEPTRLNHEARLLLIGTRHGMNCALLVSRILGLKNPDTLITVAETTEPSSRPSWQGEQLRDKESDLPTTWRRLHTAALLGDPGFLDITR